ncbi:serine/threonine-protein kinase PCRK1-like isoform X1 [Solanum pennellii]|uniref:Serine/threonine-protein kinase PCRK1-like isoform X1 n=2 Tax=Solanum pennellii TaxID=28526 RepID=A0ABM1HJC0_SOLPN|nr:serine/threonine-protein kinase PCRK1-like isoform X1 [Solanum pennellii]XP_027767715.1 serine/threonine-protein kinase PCRK1-like isoform X1 [Solanum pennellii]
MGGYFSSILKDMKCFPFYNAEKKEEPKTTKSNPVLSSSFGLFDSEFRHSHRESSSQNVSDTSSESRGRSQIPSLSDRPSDLRAFTFSELKAATKNFNRTTKIGEGGFGCVYKATVKTGEDSSKKIDVAVKQLGRRGLQGHKEWVTEVNVLGVAEHKNLVKLVGYCAEDDERGIQRLLVYEYMPNRSVENHLSARSETPLSWAMRLKIAQDAARGLAYLHEEMDVQIIFRDFKSSNILLDEQWNAKLSDFGLARLGPPEGLTHVSTAVVGTMGYAAPEYVQTGRLTSKSDVWSYGVFLYELITGRRPLDRNRPRSEQKLLEWVKPYISDSKKFQQIIDPRLDGKISRSAQKLSIVANRCLVRHAKTRPKMSEVLEMVNKVVETSTGIGNPGPPVRIAEPTSPESTRKGKRKIDTKLGDGNRLVRIWSTKLTNTC